MHDVESKRGLDRCYELSAFDKSRGFVSSFNFLAEDYAVDPALISHLKAQGFEVGVHGLSHNDGLYHSRKKFNRQAARINGYLKHWDAVGFRSPCMYHNLDWLHGLNIEYDASTFDTDPFEPQPDGVGTIFPFWVTPDGRYDRVEGVGCGMEGKHRNDGTMECWNDGRNEITAPMPRDARVAALLPAKPAPCYDTGSPDGKQRNGSPPCLRGEDGGPRVESVGGVYPTRSTLHPSPGASRLAPDGSSPAPVASGSADAMRSAPCAMLDGAPRPTGYVELPYTLPQDFTVFVIMGEKTIDIWKRKLDWIAENGGMALVNIHPDYIRFDGSQMASDEYPIRFYEELLEYISERYSGQYWNSLPRDVARYWREGMVTGGGCTGLGNGPHAQGNRQVGLD
jgi:hypothetical protein